MVNTGLTSTANVCADQLQKKSQKDNTGTLSTANLNAQFKPAKQESISELLKMPPIALANASHTSAQNTNTGTPIPAAATASHRTALLIPSGMLLPAAVNA